MAKVDFNSKKFNDEFKKKQKEHTSRVDKTINIDFSKAKIMSLVSKSWVKYLIVLAIFFLISGIIANVYFIVVNIILYLELMITAIVIFFIVKYISKFIKWIKLKNK